jgi:ribosomal protein S18 acetylase RimI-like enzyme
VNLLDRMKFLERWAKGQEVYHGLGNRLLHNAQPKATMGETNGEEGQGAQSDARIQARHPAQWQQDRTEGQEPQAGRGDRVERGAQEEIELFDVYSARGTADYALFALLLERPAWASINHKTMPTMAQHRYFIDGRPYDAWAIIVTDNGIVGEVHIENGNEIGVAVFRGYHRQGYAETAVRQIMRLNPRESYTAEISETNEPSKALFQKLGFTHVQGTTWSRTT